MIRLLSKLASHTYNIFAFFQLDSLFGCSLASRINGFDSCNTYLVHNLVIFIIQDHSHEHIRVSKQLNF